MRGASSLEVVLVAAIGLLSFAFLVPQTSVPIEKPIVVQYETHDLISERVVELPEDGSTWSTIVIYDNAQKSDADSRQLASELATTPRLRSLLAQTKCFDYTRESPWVKRYHPNIATPAFILMTDKGQVIYKASGRNLPADGEQMAAEIQYNIGRLYPAVAESRADRGLSNIRPSRGRKQSYENCGPDGCSPTRPMRPDTPPQIPDLRPQSVSGGWHFDGQSMVIVGLLVAGVLGALYLHKQGQA